MVSDLAVFLLAPRQFSVAGSVLIVVVLLVPFFVAWAVSVYENRLLWWFSEGREVLTKGNIIGSVMISTSVPCFMISFGLLGASALLGDAAGVAEIVEGTARPSATQVAIHLPLTLIGSIGLVVWLRLWAYRRKLAAQPEVRRLFVRWVVWLNVIAQVVVLALLWAVLFLFPDLVNLALQ